VCELTCKQLEALQSPIVAGLIPGRSQPPAHESPVAFGQMTQDIAFLVAHAAVYRCALAKNVSDRLAQGLCAVDDTQDSLGGIEAALDEIREQRRGDG
jgi:hypothetical protein